MTKIIEYDAENHYSRTDQQRVHLNSPQKTKTFSAHSNSADRRMHFFALKYEENALKSESRAGQSILLSEIRRGQEQEHSIISESQPTKRESARTKAAETQRAKQKSSRASPRPPGKRDVAPVKSKQSLRNVRPFT